MPARSASLPISAEVIPLPTRSSRIVTLLMVLEALRQAERQPEGENAKAA